MVGRTPLFSSHSTMADEQGAQHACKSTRSQSAGFPNAFFGFINLLEFLLGSLANIVTQSSHLIRMVVEGLTTIGLLQLSIRRSCSYCIFNSLFSCFDVCIKTRLRSLFCGSFSSFYRTSFLQFSPFSLFILFLFCFNSLIIFLQVTVVCFSDCS